MPRLPRQHRPSWWKPYKEPPKLAKVRQAGRQYATNSTAWRRIRAAVLAAEPLCRECSRADRVTAATVVDHADDDSWNNAPDNLQPLCAPCHGRKTAGEDGGFGNRHRSNDGTLNGRGGGKV